MSKYNWADVLALAFFAACAGPRSEDTVAAGDTGAPTDTAADSDTAPDSADTGCTPEGEPLVGEARIVCAPGTLESSGACTASDKAAVRLTMTCESYASSGDQTLEQETSACAVDLGAECCVCSFELDPTCDPCEIGD